MNVSLKTYAFLITKKTIEVFPHAVLLSIIMSMGGITQQIVTKFFTSEKANIYDTLYEGQIAITPPHFLEWFASYFEPLFIVPSLLIITVAIKGKSLKKILFYLSFLIFISLMISDYFFYASNDVVNNYLLNGMSNLIGSIVIALIVILSFDTGNVVNNYFENDNIIYRKIIDSLIAVLYGLAIVFIIYIINKDIYTLTTSKIDVTMKFPVQGSYGIDIKDKNSTGEYYGLFSSKIPNNQHFSWRGFTENFSLEWKKNVNNPLKRFDAEIRVLDECYNDKSKITNILSAPPTYIIKNINQINLSTDGDGLTSMYILENSFGTGKISTSDVDDVKFNIHKSKSHGYDLFRYIRPSTQIMHSSWISESSYILTFINMGKVNSKTIILNRKVDIQADRQKLKINLVSNTNTSTNMKFNCHAFALSKNESYPLESIFGGIILTLRAPVSVNKILVDIDNPEETHIKGMNGFMSIDEIDMKELSKYINNGMLNTFNLTAPIQELFIDDKEDQPGVSPSFIYVDKAQLTGEVTEDGLLRFTGSSKAIYVNEKRVNLSRWEKLETEYKLMFLSLLSAIFLFILKRFIFIFNENKQFIL